MLRPAYLSQKLDHPLPTKDGGTLRTILDARTYMLALSPDREHRAQWQRAAELLLAEADVGTLSRQIELALFFDANLNVVAVQPRARLRSGSERADLFHQSGSRWPP